jgi:hypothetical protein
MACESIVAKIRANSMIPQRKHPIRFFRRAPVSDADHDPHRHPRLTLRAPAKSRRIAARCVTVALVAEDPAIL